MEYEVASGVLSGMAVAPLVSVVDRAIFENASGKASVMSSIRGSFATMFRNPAAFVRSPPFLWIWFVYGSTYVVANSVERHLIERERAGSHAPPPVLPLGVAAAAPDHGHGAPHATEHKSSAASSPVKFLATSATNIGMSVLKDRAFTRMYGTTAPRSIPVTSLACYGLRDCITIFASFTMVEPMGRVISKNFGVSERNATYAAQLACPLLAQTVNTPFFLYGMNLYNSPHSTFAQHLQFMRREYSITLACRIGRIGPAFSIGGVFNRFLRKTFPNSVLE